MGAVSLLLAGVAASVVGSVVWHGELVRQNASVVTDESTDAATNISTALQRYDDLVATTAQSVGSGSVDAEEFGAFIRGLRLGSRYPGIIGVGYIVFSRDPAQKAVAQCLGTAAQWSTSALPASIVAMDYCSVPWLRLALLASAVAGTDAVVPGGTLGKAFESEFVLLSPYGTSPATDAQSRLAGLRGWGAALVNGTALLDKVGRGETGKVVPTLYSGATTNRSELVASSGKAAAATAGQVTIPVHAGARWTLRIRVLQSVAGLANAWLAPVLFLIGSLWFLATLAVLVAILFRSRRRAMADAAASRAAEHAEVARFDSLASASPVGILEATGTLEIRYVNGRLEAIAERTAASMLGRNWIDCVVPADRQRFLSQARAAAGVRGELDTTLRIARPSGDIRVVRLRTAGLRLDGPDLRADRYVATVEDVTDELRLQEELRHQALHDSLTGLPNRTSFTDRLEQALLTIRRRGRSCAVLYFDVDRFKIVNDGLGHGAGDALLRGLAGRLRGIARSGETLARLGGDEFGLLLPDIGEAGEAVAVAKRILRAVRSPFPVDGHEIVAGVSIGIVVPDPHSDPDTVMRQADAAMYRAKERGRSRYYVFRAGVADKSMSALQMEESLRQALARQELRVFYQPIVDLRSGAVSGAEALLRWQHPERGLVLPDEFIGVAEESGLIVAIGQWVFREVVAQLHLWDHTPSMPVLETIAVNKSARQLRDPQINADRQRALESFGVDPRRICVEITESVVMDDNPYTRRTLRSMDEAGIKVSIDDFGTGYSSLAYLQVLPVKIIKVDKRFVRHLGRDRQAEAIVSAIVDMAHHLGLRVVAEGVENDEQRRVLTAMGCDEGQGFIWSPALPPEDFAAWLREHAGVAPLPAVPAGRR